MMFTEKLQTTYPEYTQRVKKFNETLGQRYIESMAKIKEKTGFSYEEIGDYHMAIYMPEYTAKILQSKIDNDSYITNLAK